MLFACYPWAAGPEDDLPRLTATGAPRLSPRAKVRPLGLCDPETIEDARHKMAAASSAAPELKLVYSKVPAAES
jgi:hypothetical protein